MFFELKWKWKNQANPLSRIHWGIASHLGNCNSILVTKLLVHSLLPTSIHSIHTVAFTPEIAPFQHSSSPPQKPFIEIPWQMQFDSSRLTGHCSTFSALICIHVFLLQDRILFAMVSLPFQIPPSLQHTALPPFLLWILSYVSPSFFLWNHTSIPKVLLSTHHIGAEILIE